MKKIYSILFAIILVNAINAQCPSVTVTPISQTLTCNGPAATITAMFSPTTNVTAVWLGPGGSVVNVSNASPVVLNTSNPGTYTFIATNNTTSCTTTQTVNVARISTAIPNMTVNPAFANGYTLSCTTPSIIMQITSTSTLAPTTYTWTNLTTSVSAYPPTGAYTVTSPGYYLNEHMDGNMCKVSQKIYIQIDTLRPSPTSNLVGNNFLLDCNTPSINVTALSNPLLPASSYSWVAPPSTIINSNTLNVNTTSVTSNPTTFTILAQGSNGCVGKVAVVFNKNVAVPSMIVNPISQTITCNGSCKSFTATCSSGTTNIVGNWFNPDGSPMIINSSSPMIMCANVKGVYTAQFCSTISGCCSSQTVSVSSNTAIPTITVTSVFGGFTVNCTKPCLPMNINSSSTIAPMTYTWTNLNTFVSTMPSNGGFTVCTTGANGPGSYEAAFMDGNFCKVTETITVGIDTIRPSPFSSTNLPSNSFTINCFTPSLVATAQTNPMYSPASYSWTQPPNITIPSNTVSIAMVNIPGSSATYTVSAMAPNGCVGRSKVIFYKDVFVPPYSIVFTPSAITCSTPCVAMSPFGTSTVPISFTFTSPPPTTTATTSGASFCIPGTYTMNYQNQLNGCLGVTNTVVPLNSPCGVNEINFNDQISIAPNPNNGKFNVEINANIENAEIKIVNAIGQEVFRQNVKQGKNEINVGVLAKGIYHYSIIQNKEPVSRGKILIE